MSPVIEHFLVAEVGTWLHAASTVEETSRLAEFWEFAEIPHADLIARIRAAGGIAHEHALEAAILPNGETLMVDGCHRWAVTRELGIQVVPVDMNRQPGHEVLKDLTWLEDLGYALGSSCGGG